MVSQAWPKHNVNNLRVDHLASFSPFRNLKRLTANVLAISMR